MRKLLLGLLISVFTTGFASQSKYLSFNDGYVSSKTFNPAQRTIKNGDSFVEVEYKFDGAYLKEVADGDDKAYLRMYMDGALYTATNSTMDESTYKRLPFFKDIIVLTKKADAQSAKIEIIEEKHQDYKCPFQETTLSELLNNSNYGKITNDESKTFYPDYLSKFASKSTFRTIPFTTVNTCPVWFDDKTNTLRCYSYIKYRVVFEEKDDVTTEMSQLAYDLLSREASNPEMLQKFDNTILASEATSKECDYLIVTVDKYKVAAEKLANWKSILGYKSHILSKEQWKGNYPEYISDSIRTFCKTLKHKPDYLLILGSHKDVSARNYFYTDDLGVTNQTSKSWYSDSYLSRFSYFGTDNDDMIKGRISVYSPEEAIAVVDKIIAYEQNPPTDSEFYNNALAISLFDANSKYNNLENKSYDFLSSTEGVSLDLEKMKYNVDRHYINYAKGLPQYFLNGDKMPEFMYMEEGVENDFWDKESSHINDLINKGKSIVVYEGHGNEGAFSNGTYTQEDVAKLKNGNKTPVFFNFACSTGAFYYKDKDSLCFAECLLNKADGGAVGVYANTRTILHTESKTIGSKMLEILFKNQDLSIASAILEASLSTEFDYTSDLAQYFGDPSMRLYTVNPAVFKPFINRGKNNTITVDPYVKGAKITVCSIADMGMSYYKSVKVSDETKVEFSNVTVPCYITISKANYVPFVTVSKNDLFLQNMTLNGGHNIVAENITTGENVTKDYESGLFVVESGSTKLTASKSLSLKSGTSVKLGASFSAKVKKDDSFIYKGNGNPREMEYPLCFNTLTDRFSTSDNNLYDGNHGNGQATSIADNSSDSNITIYPNPTTAIINVVSNDNIINEVAVMDIAGNVVVKESANSNNVSLDLSSFAKGMYLVKVVTAEDSLVKKVVLK